MVDGNGYCEMNRCYIEEGIVFFVLYWKSLIDEWYLFKISIFKIREVNFLCVILCLLNFLKVGVYLFGSVRKLDLNILLDVRYVL